MENNQSLLLFRVKCKGHFPFVLYNSDKDKNGKKKEEKEEKPPAVPFFKLVSYQHQWHNTC